jgi:hypothetical protein
VQAPPQSAIALAPAAPPVTDVVVALITVDGSLIRLVVEFRYTMPVPVLGFGLIVPPGVPGGVADAEPVEKEGVTGELDTGVDGDLDTNRRGDGSWICVGRLLAMAPNDDETEGTGTAGLSP